MGFIPTQRIDVFHVPFSINIGGGNIPARTNFFGKFHLFGAGGGGGLVSVGQRSEVMFARVSFAASGCPATPVQLPQVPS